MVCHLDPSSSPRAHGNHGATYITLLSPRVNRGTGGVEAGVYGGGVGLWGGGISM